MSHASPRKALVGLATALLLTATACASPAADGGTTAAGGGDSSGENTLVIASWGGRFTEATQKNLVDPFEQETGIDVQIVDAPGTQFTQLKAQRDAGKMQWDVMDSLNGGDAYVIDAAGLLEPLTSEQSSTYAEELGADKVSDFGYNFSTLAYVVVCAKTVERCPTTVPEFFDVNAFPGTRAFPGSSPGPTTGLLAAAAGEELPVDVDQLVQPLRALKPHVKVFYTSGDQQEQLIRQGEVDMSIMYSGRAYNLQDSGTPVTINWSGVYDPGFTAQVKDAPHPEAARKFMDWVAAHPKAQAAWAEQMLYSVPSPQALEELPTSVAERLADYPANYQGLAKQDFPWYVANKQQIDTTLNQIIQGS